MTTLAQRSFGSGELSPALYARCDVAKYSTGARTVRNFTVMKQGGLARRPGTSFCAEVGNSAQKIRLIPFVYSNAASYVLEFGNQYMRVYKNGALVTLSQIQVDAITQANPAVVTTDTPHGLSTGNEIVLSGVQGMTALNNRNFLVTVLTTTTFSLQYKDGMNVNTTAMPAFVAPAGMSQIYQIATPYAYTDLPLLQFVQSGDLMTFAHASYPPKQLLWGGQDTSWTMTTFTVGPAIAAPTGLSSTTGSGTPPNIWIYGVTAVDADTGEESLMSASLQVSNTGPPSTPVVLTWNPVTNAGYYNLYRQYGGIFGYIASIGGGLTSYSDDNTGLPDLSTTPPIARNPFSGAGNYPSTVSYFQQRLLFANTTNNPETVYATRSGQFYNFTVSQPGQADDAITFTLAGRKVNAVQQLVDMTSLVILTQGGELAALGDGNGALTPTGINVRQYSYYGSSPLQPIVIGRELLYVQARQNLVRSMVYNYLYGFTGQDLTIYSTHLFENYTIEDWAYSQVPDSTLWAVRSDGTLLGLTYIPEQQMMGWHRHDFDGTVEAVCSIPESNADSVYIVVNRTINGETKRYVERLNSRYFTDIRDYVGMDAALKYDGRNTTTQTMTLSGGTGNWDYTQTLTLTASMVGGGLNFQTDAKVGDQIFLNLVDQYGNVDQIRFTIASITSATVVTGSPNKNVPAGLQGVAITSWEHAVQSISGMWHLEGQNIAILGDGFVVGSPLNPAYPTYTVTNGAVTLDRPYAVISAGLPIISDLETLDVDSPQGDAPSDKNKLVTAVSLYIESSRGIFAGVCPPSIENTNQLYGLTELKIREYEQYDSPVNLATKVVTINIEGHWNSNGRVFVRQVDPLPLQILAAYPAGLFPMGGR